MAQEMLGWGETVDPQAIGTFLSLYTHPSAEIRVPALKSFIDAAMLCESPIEQHMLAVLMIERDAVHRQRETARMAVLPQHSVGSYRIDIAVIIETKGFPIVQIAVECDGHAFHEKTPDQAERDKKRDRFFLSNNWIPARFAGREILRDPMACLNDVVDIYEARLSAAA